jgi:COMPASS component SPP1
MKRRMDGSWVMNPLVKSTPNTTDYFSNLKKLTSTPGIPPNFWETTPAHLVFTDEETTLLSKSQSERHALGEEIILSRKMLSFVDHAVKNRETLLQSPSYPTITKDFCGYDYRLDTVGAPASFAAFIAPSQPGETILTTGKLELPSDKTVEALAAVMCTKKKCKPHTGWIGILTKMVKHQIKELAAQAKEMLDYEARIKDCAAVRYRRKQRENHSVEVVGRMLRDVDMEDTT